MTQILSIKVLFMACLLSAQAMAQSPGPVQPPSGTRMGLRQGGGQNQAPGPCRKIAEICKGVGFIPGDWKKGDGLWRDCVDPIIQGKTTVPGGTKALPAVPAALIANCKAKRPGFGEGKVGSSP